MSGDADMNTPIQSELDKDCIDVDQYRRLVRHFVDLRRYQTALFWAEKVCALSKNDPDDLYCLAEIMFLLKEYHRAAQTVRRHELEKSSMQCYNLLLDSLYEAKDYKDAVNVINAVDMDHLTSSLAGQIPMGQHRHESSRAAAADSCPSMTTSTTFGGEDVWKNELLASVCVIKGKIFEAMENRGMAMDCYVQALHNSVFCYEALDALVQHEMLMAWEENDLMKHLPLSQQTTEANAKVVKMLYECKLKKYYETLNCPLDEHPSRASIKLSKSVKDLMDGIDRHRTFHVQLPSDVLSKYTTPGQGQVMSPANMLLEELKATPFSLHMTLSRVSARFNESQRSHVEPPPKPMRVPSEERHVLTLATCLERLHQSTDMMAAAAERLFYDCEYAKCLKTLQELLNIDPYHTKALIVQISCLAEADDYNKLFYVAHKLVDRYPDKAISWYAVGCYYDMIGKSDPARRYLSKATSIDRLFGPAWLSYGHSFAHENEHDQAMAAYFKATQLMRGCHLPLLYIGVECGLTKNIELAERFFYQALTVAPMDVFVMHALGVVKHEYEYYESAEEVFRTTVEVIRHRARENHEEISSRWEPLFNNLGHCCRKNRKLADALEFHQQAQLLRPDNPRNVTAIGFIYALMGDLDTAVTYFHKSLAIDRHCIVTATILKTCIVDLMQDDSFVNDICGAGMSTTELLARKFKPHQLAKIEEQPSTSQEAQMKRMNPICLNFEEEDTSNSDLSMSMNIDPTI